MMKFLSIIPTGLAKGVKISYLQLTGPHVLNY